jgi:hypothetical protein
MIVQRGVACITAPFRTPWAGIRRPIKQFFAVVNKRHRPCALANNRHVRRAEFRIYGGGNSDVHLDLRSAASRRHPRRVRRPMSAFGGKADMRRSRFFGVGDSEGSPGILRGCVPTPWRGAQSLERFVFRREHPTLPGRWAGSCWYFCWYLLSLRQKSNHSINILASE